MVLKVHVLEEKPGQEVQDEAEEGPSLIIYLKELRCDIETVCFPHSDTLTTSAVGMSCMI